MMDDEPERMDPRCDAGGRGSMLWMQYCNDGEYVRATDYDALAAKLALVIAAYRIEAMRRDDYSHDAFDQHIAELRVALSALEKNK